MYATTYVAGYRDFIMSRRVAGISGIREGPPLQPPSVREVFKDVNYEYRLVLNPY